MSRRAGPEVMWSEMKEASDVLLEVGGRRLGRLTLEGEEYVLVPARLVQPLWEAALAMETLAGLVETKGGSSG